MSLLLLFNSSSLTPLSAPEGSLFGYQNAVDTASILADSEANSMRSFNLADPILQRRWRSLSLSASFTAIFENSTKVDFLALAGATLGQFDQVQHQLYDDSGIIALDVTIDANVAEGYGVHFFQLAAPIVAAKWVCTIQAPSRDLFGYFDVGRAWAGPGFMPANGISPGYANGWLDGANPGYAQYSGISFVTPGAKRRAMSFSFDFMDEDDYDACMDMMAYCGVSRQVFFVPFTTGKWPRQAILGKFTDLQLITEPVVTFPATFSQKFTIQQDT